MAALPAASGCNVEICSCKRTIQTLQALSAFLLDQCFPSGRCNNPECGHDIGNHQNLPRTLNLEVEYHVAPLDPTTLPTPISWMTEPLAEPLPTGHIYANNRHITSTSISQDLLTSELRIWLEGVCGDGEASQHHRNDGILKAIMLLAGLPLTNFSRNSSVATTGNDRPNFVVSDENVPILICEEKEGNNIQGAIYDCVQNFSFIPSLERFNYFICLAVCFTKITIIQIERNALQPRTHTVNITTESGRVNFLQHAVNIARILKFWTESGQIIRMNHPMHRWISRSGKDIFLGFRGCKVRYKTKAKYESMRKFYIHCRNANVPHLERMAEFNDTDWVMLMQPLGSSRLPENFGEMFRALRAIMEATQGIHGLGWCHTDIRWDNIVYEDSPLHNWCLIDCFNVTKSNPVAKEGTRTRRQVKPRIVSLSDDKRQIADLITKFPNIGMATRQSFAPLLNHLNNNAPFQTIFNCLTTLENNLPTIPFP